MGNHSAKPSLQLRLLAKNPLRLLPGNTVEMSLTRGKVALIDFADLPLVIGYRWHTHESRPGAPLYAYTNLPTRRPLSMHALITGTKNADHINLDGLDNRRENLRPATNTQQRGNQRVRKDSQTGYRGVALYKPTGSYRAYITRDGRLRSLGYYETAEQAARAYDFAAREVYGEYAHLNFPPPRVASEG